ncbi:conserved Plasmodium protein, unknown function [Plasmodium relictum]|uniref:Uncharacterized protein n=1 Tax=Plasmodium relictum TaxID=85471 RepID=A0A1J1HDT9_PLARL|nr:conserved Plasmodium protein, unknown function [Plasmodium relictum]CRH03104.1 conserved Plasmodium protein, unknown function [Plasmodium relictum]
MSQFYDVSREISQTESIKHHLKQLYGLVNSEFGYFCRNNGDEYSFNRINDFSKSSLMPFFSSWKMDDLANFDLNSIFSILRRNQFFMICISFLGLFSCIYITSLILYSKCARRIIKLFTSCCIRTKKKREDGDEDELEDENRASRDTLKIFKNILTYFFLCIFLCGLIITGSFFLHYFFKTKKGIHMNICNVSKTFENLIKDKCPSQIHDNIPCFSVEKVINEAISILQKYKNLKKQVEDNSLVDINKPIPFLAKYTKSFNNLSKLKNILARNNNVLERRYLHMYPALIGLERALDSIIYDGGNHFKKTEDTIIQIKIAIKKTFDNIDYSISQSFRGNYDNIVEKIQLASYFISEFNGKYKFKENINKYTNSIPFIFVVLLLPPLIILIGLIFYIICIIKGDALGNNNFFFKLFSLFSAYFGFLTIISLIVTTVLMGFSILGGTTCAITEDVLQKKIDINFLNNTIIEKCFVNENAALIDEKDINLFTKKINIFNPRIIEDKLNEYEIFFNNIKHRFYQNSDKFFEYMWVVLMKTDNNRYYNKIKTNDIKDSLPAIGITKESFHFINKDLIGIDEYLRILNQRIFHNNNNKLCFEDDICQNDPDKYNITEKSSIDDQKYIQLRDQINVLIREDVDELVQLFILKAKIRHDKIFDVSDLDNTITEKLEWKKYTPKTDAQTRKNSIIYNYITNTIDSINFIEIKNFCNQIKIQFSLVKELIIKTIRSISKNTRCNRIMKEIQNAKYFFCNKIVLNLTILSIFLFSFSVTSFILWFFFLFLWLRHKLSIM